MSAGRRERGFIVVAVLWIVGALAALVTVYSRFVTNTAFAAFPNGDRPQIEALATAGVELAALRILSSELRPGAGQFDVQIGPHRIGVSFVSEAARIDLNAAPKSLLAGLFAALGADDDAAKSYAERIIAWRTPAGEEADNETPLYRAAGVAYRPRRGPFPVADELWLVRGIPEVFISRALPHLTTFSGQPSVDRAIAAPLVLAALPDMTPERLQSTFAGQGLPRVSETNSKAYRIALGMELAHGQTSTSEAVILLPGNGPEPYHVLAWRDGADGELPRVQRATR